ncbi:MAG TPA: hypothetical protein VJ304_13145, partial [Flavobacterium sp.]|nr:hypothetical protein [Flavobacterium sp.]
MKYNFAFLLLFVFSAMFSQEDAWVYFKDKPSSPLFLNKPLDMLTQRSLDRRTNQNIALNLADVPVEKSYITQIKASSGITIMAKSKWLNAVHIRGNQANITALKSFSFVDKVVFANKTLNVTSRKVSGHKETQTSDKLKTTIDYAYGNSA